MKPPSELFVVGSGRSGTTIVLSALAALDDVAAVPRLAGRVPASTWLVSRGLRHGIGPDSWLRPSSESTEVFAEAGLTQEFQISLGGRSATPADAPTLRMDRMAKRLKTIRNGAAVRTVAVKNTASCGRVPLLADTFPDAPFVHVLRPVRPVVASLLSVDFWPTMTLWWDGRTTQQYAHDEQISDARVAARHWARQVTTALDDLGRLAPERVVTMHFDRFTRDPVGELARLNTWGLDTSDPARVARALAPLGIRERREPSITFSDADVAAIDEESHAVTERAGLSS